MKKDGKYRFSLQFGSETEEEVMVGEFLERLGNKKSELIVPVLAEYLIMHPELLESKNQIKVQFTSNYSQEMIEKIVRSIIDEKLVDGTNTAKYIKTGEKSETNEEDIVKMLGNLDLFIM